MAPEFPSNFPLCQQKQGSLKEFETEVLEVYPTNSSTHGGEAVLSACVMLARDSQYAQLIKPWFLERAEMPGAEMPKVPVKDLELFVKTVTDRGFKHLIIESAGAQRLETLVANALVDYLRSASHTLSITRLEQGNTRVAFTTWSVQKSGEPLRS